jgi:N-succinyldiaminopimelate aminotransferase
MSPVALVIRGAGSWSGDVMVGGLRAAGISMTRADGRPYGTFYVWGSLAELPEPIGDGEAFFFAALEHHVITVPGRAFDLNPGDHRHDAGAFDGHTRFSFGPSIDNVAEGVARIRAMVDGYR